MTRHIRLSHCSFMLSRQHSSKEDRHPVLRRVAIYSASNQLNQLLQYRCFEATHLPLQLLDVGLVAIGLVR